MPGRLLSRTWMHDPLLHAPAKYRRACRYQAYVPDRVADLDISLPADTLGAVSEAEHAVRDLNESGHPAFAPLARLLLRTESIASSKVEGLQVGVRELARAEARVEGGGRASQTAIDILANIDAMELAIREAASVKRFGVKQIVTIHHRLMQNAPNAKVAGRLRTQQNWIGGNDYNPCGADFVPPPPDEIDGLLADLCAAVNDDVFPPLVQAALVHAQFETIHPFDDGNGRTGRALIHVVLRRRGLAPAYVPPISVMFAKGTRPVHRWVDSVPEDVRDRRRSRLDRSFRRRGSDGVTSRAGLPRGRAVADDSLAHEAATSLGAARRCRRLVAHRPVAGAPGHHRAGGHLGAREDQANGVPSHSAVGRRRRPRSAFELSAKQIVGSDGVVGPAWGVGGWATAGGHRKSRKA